jgi:hypothetical protein
MDTLEPRIKFTYAPELMISGLNNESDKRRLHHLAYRGSEANMGLRALRSGLLVSLLVSFRNKIPSH